MSLDQVRTVADAVLYEGYLLYPYRASSDKNRARWQFGVLGPTGAADAGIGEESSMAMQCLLQLAGPAGEACGKAGAGAETAELQVHLRFLQLQQRQVYDAADRAVDRLQVEGSAWLSWDEAVEQEVTLPLSLARLATGAQTTTVTVDGSEQREPILTAAGVEAGHVVRRRWPVAGQLEATTEPCEGYTRLELRVDNTGPAVAGRDQAIRTSLIGAHLIVELRGAGFVSLLDPPVGSEAAVLTCRQKRCWPVLAGTPGDRAILLGAPIILYDYPQVAPESAGALFDATEIDEILTLRVLTMTDEEKAEARATDPRVAEIVDRCEQMSPAAVQRLHGVLRDPRAGRSAPSASFDTDGVPWWDPAEDAAVRPDQDAVLIDGQAVCRGSLVRVHPKRTADAQDLFFTDQVARVTAVLHDVDGGVHVAVLLVDDPGADLLESYGRFLYFAPDELEPLAAEPLAVEDQERPPTVLREEISP